MKNIESFRPINNLVLIEKNYLKNTGNNTLKTISQSTTLLTKIIMEEEKDIQQQLQSYNCNNTSTQIMKNTNTLYY